MKKYDICGEIIIAMAEEIKKPTNSAEAEKVVDERPNRSAYQKMFNEDYPDVDFEDKEARYGKMVEDRQNYKKMMDSGRKLSSTLGKHRWMAAMWQDLSEDEVCPAFYADRNMSVFLHIQCGRQRTGLGQLAL